MKNFIYTLLAAAMAACSTPAFAQGYATDKSDVALDVDFVMSDGTRCVTATPFLAHKDSDFTLVLDVMLFVPEGGHMDDWDWTLEARVRYTNPDFGGDRDITRPFAPGNVFGMYVHKPYRKELYLKETGKLQVRTVEQDGHEWLVGSFRFDSNELLALFRAGDVDMIGYTQGGEEPFAQVFSVTTAQYESMMVASVLAVLNRMQESYGE